MKQALINWRWRWIEFRNSFRPITADFNDPHRAYGRKLK